MSADKVAVVNKTAIVAARRNARKSILRFSDIGTSYLPSF